MRKIITLAFVGMLALALASPVYAGRGHGGGGSHGGRGGGSHGSHGRFPSGGFHHGGHFHRGCCFGPAFVGGVFVGSALAYPYYSYPYYSSHLLQVRCGHDGSRLSAADAAIRGPVAGGLLRRRVLPSPGRWRDGGLPMDLDSDRAESAASSTERPTRGAAYIGDAGPE